MLDATMRSASAPLQRTVANDGLEAAKLAAIGLMIVDHTLLALPEPWATVGHFAGRPCLVLFSYILGTRLATGGPGRAGRAGRASRRLAIWALAAQPVYLLLVGGVALRLDVLFALAAGAGAVALVQARRWKLAAALGIATLAVGPWLDGGALTALAVVASAAGVRRGRPAAGLAAASLAIIAANLLASPDRPLAAAAALAGPLIVVAARWAPAIPRLPSWSFYAIYPAHLFVIWLAFGPYR